MPDLYRQASPSSTNPHWQAEISAGPVLAARGKKKGNASISKDSGALGGRGGAKSRRSNGSQTPSSTDVSLRPGGSSRDGRVDSSWRFQRYQRDDEPYISGSMERLASSSTLDGSTSQRSILTSPARAQVRAGEGRNPQINDLHPATVTKVGKEEASWLMAPPPVAEFMNGKDRSSRSRSDSGGSRLSSRSGVPLSREVSRRIMQQKLRSGESLLVPPLSRESTLSRMSGPTDKSTTDEKDFAIQATSAPRSVPPQIQVSEDSSSSTQTTVRSPELVPEQIRARRVASRPQLSTIASDSLLPTDIASRGSSRSRDTTPKENIRHSSDDTVRDRTTRRTPVLVKDDSLRALQDLAPSSPILKTQIVSSQAMTADTRPKQTRLPTQDASEEKALDVSPEMFDSWYTSDFELPEYIYEHTRREVKHRWSMDI